MSQEFIKQPNLPVTKSMPSLMGINLNGIQKQTGYGDIIAKGLQYTNALVEKADTIKQNNELTNLKQKFDDMENEFAFQYLSDPNVYNTDEGRKTVIDAYNNLIEQKKTILQDSNVELSKDNRDKLVGYFKDTTWNKLLTIQPALNQGFLKEQTDNVLLSSEKSIMLLPTYTDPLQQESAVAEQLQNIKALERFGINTDKMQLQYLTKSQEAITDKKINVDIINNNTDEKFYKTEIVDGKPVVIYDTNGNPIIDATKKLTALHELANTFLSDEECMESAKSLHNQTGMDLDTAYAYIRNARKEKWIKTYYTSSAKLAQQQSIEAEKARKIEQKITDNIDKNTNTAKDAIQDKDLYKLSTVLDANNIGLDVPTMLMGQNNIEGLTNCEFFYGDSPESLYQNGFYMDILSPNELKYFNNSIETGADGSLNFGSFDSTMNLLSQYTIDKTSGQRLSQPFVESIVTQFSESTNEPLLKHPEFVKAGLKMNEEDTSKLNYEEISQLINATKLVPQINTGMGTYKNGIILNEKQNSEINYVLGAYAIANRSKYSLDINEKSSMAMIDNAIRKNPVALQEFKKLQIKLNNGISAPKLKPKKINEVGLFPTIEQTAREQAINNYYKDLGRKNQQAVDSTWTGKSVRPQFKETQTGVLDTMNKVNNETFLSDLINNPNVMSKYKNIENEILTRDFTESQLKDCLYNLPINSPYRQSLNNRFKQIRQ